MKNSILKLRSDEWSNGILNGTFIKLFSFFFNGILNAEELLISTIENTIGPFSTFQILLNSIPSTIQNTIDKYHVFSNTIENTTEV